MIWIQDINNLQYYKNPTGAPCYCEQLIYPSDLLLQGNLSSNAKSGYVFTFKVYSPDGKTLICDVSDNFEYYIALNPITGKIFFNSRCKTFADCMCDNPCYIIRVQAFSDLDNGAIVFDFYTEQYCQASCCDIPRGIIIIQEGVVSHRDSGGLNGDPTDPIGATALPKIDQCGDPFITIRTTFSCYDAFSGDYYSIPSTVYDGTASFTFQKILNLVAKFVQRPREIKRQVSYNCFVQRSESFKPFVLQGASQSALVPTWKMNEIESMLHAEHIYINDYVHPETEFQFAGGVIFEQVYKCWEIFKLTTILQTCTARQTFGCTPNCNPADTVYYIIPPDYNGFNFYSSNRAIIATNIAELAAWFQGFEGVYNIEDISGGYPLAAGAYAISSTGYLPNYFYFDQTSITNRVFGTATAPDGSFKVACNKPIAGSLTITDNICNTPTFDTPIVTTQDGSFADITSYGMWIDVSGFMGANAVTIFDGVATINIELQNGTFPPSGSPLTAPNFTNEYIGTISLPGRPTAIRYITNTENGAIPLGSYLSIDTSGRMYWTGLPTSTDSDNSYISLPSIYYNI